MLDKRAWPELVAEIKDDHLRLLVYARGGQYTITLPPVIERYETGRLIHLLNKASNVVAEIAEQKRAEERRQ